MKLLIFKEKHGERYFDISTAEKELDAYYQIAIQRINDDYWYDTDCVIPEEPEISKEQISLMKNSGLKTMAVREWENYERNLKYLEECKKIDKIIGLVKSGDKRAAKQLIMIRQDYEYEGFEIAETEN